MNLKIRPADLDADRGRIIETLSRHLTAHSSGTRFDWLYRANPDGPARAWIAEDGATGETVGVASAFPRKVRSGAETHRCWVLGDFCIGGSYRALGPAVQLQRACLAEVEAGAVPFCYDFPSESMMAVYRRLSIDPYGSLVRYALPLRVDRKVRERIPVAPLARALSAAGNKLLAWLRRLPTQAPERAIALHSGAIGSEFADLADASRPPGRVVVDRRGAYLGWRYGAHPVASHEAITARGADGRLTACAVFTQAGEEAIVVDLFGTDGEPTLAALLGTLARLAVDRGAATLSAPMIETHRWAPLLGRLGFTARERAPIVLHGRSEEAARIAAMPWDLLHGDRDS